MKKPIKQSVGDFLAGRGFYIVLFLCVAAIGVSGWYLMSELILPAEVPVGGPATVTVSTSPAPTVPPTVKPTPVPSARPSAAPTPSAPAPSPSPSEAVSLWGGEVYTWPVKGQVISDFSLEVLAYDETMGDWRTHSGIDIAAPVGTQVLAVSAGTVASVEQDDLMGTTVVIAHAGGVESIYANLAAVPTVEAGDQVSIGAVIGAVGTTAVAESARAPHLHFEMREDGESVDPVSYLPE